MSAPRNPGRVAGLLYLLLLGASVRLGYIPDKLFVDGNATATADNIAAHELLFRLGMVCDLFTATVGIFVALALYRLLKGVSQNHAMLMVILGGPMVSVIYFLNVLNDAAALILARGADFVSVIEKPQRDALAMLFLRLHHHGVLINEVFWGLWLFPLGILVFRSGFLPRFLGVWLIINGFAYPIITLTGLLLPQHEGMVSYLVFPAELGELVFILWLVIRGATPGPSIAAASATSGG